jgi:VCBS repeat protein
MSTHIFFQTCPVLKSATTNKLRAWRNLFQLNHMTSRTFLALCAACIFFALQLEAGAQSQPVVHSTVAPLVEQPERATRQNTNLPSKRYGLRADVKASAIELSRYNRNYVVPVEPNQIGIHRPVGATSTSNGHAFRNNDGSQVVFFVISSPGALSIRVHFDNFDLAAGDEVFVYGNSDESSAAGPYRSKGRWNDSDFWSETIEGNIAIIEYYQKGDSGGFRIPDIAHVFEELHADGNPGAPDTLSCEVDASCFSDVEKNAVGRIVFDRSDGSFVCTGTALNDRAGDFAPYFLTANHCVSTQTVARTVESYWFYQTTSCNSGVLKSNWVRRGSGADLLVTDQSNDATLLRLIDSVPGGASFSGWDSGTVTSGTAVFGLHHPDGYSPPSVNSYLRRSAGNITTTGSACSASGLTSAFNVAWSSGTIEGGSSGSGLWTTDSQSKNHLVGDLSCGPDPDTCSNPYGIYGKFSNFFPEIRFFIYPAVKSDFNGDGTSDIIWQSKSTGQRYLWTMSGGQHTGNADLGFVSTDWDIVGTGDFNGDGQVDILWQNRNSGQRYLWLMTGAQHTGNVDLGFVSTDWDIVGTGDFNGDGKIDILWQNRNSGQRYLWLMTGAQHTGNVDLGFVSTDWDIVGTGDFNGDGRVDVVWQNRNSGQRYLWLMTGAQHTGNVNLGFVSTDWDIAGIGDFNGDGQVDIVWQNHVSGQRYLWLMNGAQHTGNVDLGNVSTDWNIRNH